MPKMDTEKSAPRAAERESDRAEEKSVSPAAAASPELALPENRRDRGAPQNAVLGAASGTLELGTLTLALKTREERPTSAASLQLLRLLPKVRLKCAVLLSCAVKRTSCTSGAKDAERADAEGAPARAELAGATYTSAVSAFATSEGRPVKVRFCQVEEEEEPPPLSSSGSTELSALLTVKEPSPAERTRLRLSAVRPGPRKERERGGRGRKAAELLPAATQLEPGSATVAASPPAAEQKPLLLAAPRRPASSPSAGTGANCEPTAIVSLSLS